MTTRLINTQKTTRSSDNKDIENEFEIELTHIKPSLFANQIENQKEKNHEEVDEIENKNNNEDEIIETDEDDNDNKNDDDDDDSQNFRDKDKEIKEAVKSGLSLESQDVINLNDDEFNAIIEQLKKRGISKDKGIELQKLRNITHGRSGINR